MELTAKKIQVLCSWISPRNPTNSVRDVCLRTLPGLSKNAHMTTKSNLHHWNNRAEPPYSQRTLFPILVWVRPNGKEVHAPPQGTWAAPREAGLAWALLLTLISTCPSLRRIPCYGQRPGSQSSIKCCVNSFRSPFPTRFTPTALTWPFCSYHWWGWQFSKDYESAAHP